MSQVSIGKKLFDAVGDSDAKVFDNLLKGATSEDINYRNGGKTVLMHSIESPGSTLATEKLLAHPGIKINLTDYNGRTALMKTSSVAAVGKILAIPDIDVNIQDEDGDTAMIETWYRYKKSSKEKISLCLAHPKIKVNIQNKNGISALMTAVLEDQSETVQMLVAYPGIDVNLQSKGAWTALMRACARGRTEAVRLLLAHRSIDVNLQSDCGDTALIIATYGEAVEIVEMLLAYPGININAQNKFGYTALMAASSNGFTLIVEKLLFRSGIDRNAQNELGFSALHLASMKGHTTGVVKLLLTQLGVDINLRSKGGLTALQYAHAYGREDTIKMLMARPNIAVDSNDLDGRLTLELARQSLLQGDQPPKVAAVSVGEKLMEAIDNKDQDTVSRLLINATSADINYQNEKGDTALICASAVGYTNIVQILLSHADIDPNKRNKVGRTALNHAVLYGFEAIVRMLLPRRAGNDGLHTYLPCAAYNGRTAVVQLLLAQPDMKLNKDTYSFAETSLHSAATEGHAEIVSNLLAYMREEVCLRSRDVSKAVSLAAGAGHCEIVKMLLYYPNEKAASNNKHELKALIEAVSMGRSNIVEMLLKEPNLCLNNTDMDGNTPLMLAASQGRTDIVEMLVTQERVKANLKNKEGKSAVDVAKNEAIKDLLLAHGAKSSLVEAFAKGVNIRNKNEETTLMEACSGGYTFIVQHLLLQPDINVNLQNKSGSTALHLASRFGKKDGVVKLLLAHPRIDVNKQDVYKCTALMEGVSRHLDIVAVLVKHPNIDLNLQNKYGETALMIASRENRSEVVTLLLAHPNVDVNCKDHRGCSPIYTAASNAHTKIVQLLLAHPKLTVNAENEFGVTALMKVCKEGHASSAELLLGHPQIAVNAQCKDGSTALFAASSEKRIEVVKMLLAHAGIDANIQNETGVTALIEATAKGHKDIVKLLLAHPDIDPNVLPTYGYTALMEIAYEQMTKMDLISLFLAHPRIDANIQDQYGETVLLKAAALGREEFIKLPLGHASIDVNLQKKNGRTPLMEACCRKNRSNTVKMLLSHPKVNANLQDKDGDTALSIASSTGLVELVKILLAQKVLNPYLRNQRGKSALDVAASAEIKVLLLEHAKIAGLLSRWKPIGGNTDGIDATLSSSVHTPKAAVSSPAAQNIAPSVSPVATTSSASNPVDACIASKNNDVVVNIPASRGPGGASVGADANDVALKNSGPHISTAHSSLSDGKSKCMSPDTSTLSPTTATSAVLLTQNSNQPCYVEASPLDNCASASSKNSDAPAPVDVPSLQGSTATTDVPDVISSKPVGADVSTASNSVDYATISSAADSTDTSTLSTVSEKPSPAEEHGTRASTAASAVIAHVNHNVPSVPSEDSEYCASWLALRLLDSGVHAPLVKECEQKLVLQEGFASERCFAECLPDMMDHAYLTRIGVSGMGLQHLIVKLHRELHAQHNIPRLPLRLQVEDKTFSEFVCGTSRIQDVTHLISDANSLRGTTSSRLLLQGHFSNSTIEFGRVSTKKYTCVIKCASESAVCDPDSKCARAIQREFGVYSALMELAQKKLGATSTTTGCVECYYMHPLAHYLVLEAHGQDIRCLLVPTFKFAPQLAEAIIGAVAALHSFGIMHGDIKPHNILFELHPFTIKLCDLDCAYKVGEVCAATALGTKQYESPEVYFASRAGESVTAALSMDMFSLGVVLWQVLARSAYSPLNSEMLDEFYSDQEKLFAQLSLPEQSGIYVPLLRSVIDINTFHRINADTLYMKVRDIAASKAQHNWHNEKQEHSFLKEIVSDKLDGLNKQFQQFRQEQELLGLQVGRVLRDNIRLDTMMCTLIAGTHTIPTYAIILPVVAKSWRSKVDPMRVVRHQYRLYFLCSHTHQIAPCGPKGEGYTITVTKQWVRDAAPVLMAALIVLKVALLAGGLPLPIPDLSPLLDSPALHAKFLNASLHLVQNPPDDLRDTQYALDSAIDALDSVRVEDVLSAQNKAGLPLEEASRRAYETIHEILKKDNINIALTCGLRQVTHPVTRKTAWVLDNDTVAQQYCDSVSSTPTAASISTTSTTNSTPPIAQAQQTPMQNTAPQSTSVQCSCIIT